MSLALSPNEIRNKNKARLWTALWVVLLLILLIIPILTYQDPPPGQEGILVNLGLPDQGQGNENAAPSQSEAEPQDEPVEEPQEEESEPQEPVEPVEEPEPVEEEPVATEKEVVTSPDPDEVALEKAKEREKQRRAEEARKKAEAEAEARRKAQEEKARKQAEADKLKDDLGGLFGSGEGKGETGKPGNQGDPEGDPDADKLKGLSTGPGKVGGGLGGRGVVNAPKLSDKSQKQGTVTVGVCVDKAGNVTSAKFKQSGTTISDLSLIKLAESNARKWKFASGSTDRQCGTITYTFKLQ